MGYFWYKTSLALILKMEKAHSDKKYLFDRTFNNKKIIPSIFCRSEALSASISSSSITQQVGIPYYSRLPPARYNRVNISSEYNETPSSTESGKLFLLSVAYSREK